MVLRPEDIEQREFGSALRGFDKAEVRAFLRRVAGEVRFLESEVEAVRESSSIVPSEPRPDASVIESRPAPPVLPPSPPVDFPPRDLPDLGVAGSQLPNDQAEEPALSLVSSSVSTPPDLSVDPGPADPGPVDIDSDRFGALGERIANLLRNAQTTAEQVRHQAEVEAAEVRAEAAAAGVELRASADEYAVQVRSDAAADADELRSSAEQYATDLRETADADVAALRAEAEATLTAAKEEAAGIREEATAEATALSETANTELETARTEAASAIAQAEADAVGLRQRAIDEGEASLASREQLVTSQEAEAAESRNQAMAELADARGQVSSLLQEARAQSEFIRQESEEIIRTKVRANMEQAQRRIDMLRTTETASKDRISAARKELESALARLDSEPAPGLPAGTEDLVLEEAQQTVIGSDSTTGALADPADAITHDVIDVNTVSNEAGETISGTTFDEPVADQTVDLVTNDSPSDLGAEQFIAEFGGSETDPDPTTTDPVDLETVDVETVDVETAETEFVDVETVDVEPVGTETGETANVDITDVDVDQAADDDFVDPGVGQTVHGGSFFAPRTDTPPPPPPPGFGTTLGTDEPTPSTPLAGGSDFEFTPGQGLPSSDDPLDGLIPGESVLEKAAEGTETDEVSDIDTPENEDALAKLVREAMQRAVDSARGNQS